jgi:hypothetical protein
VQFTPEPAKRNQKQNQQMPQLKLPEFKLEMQLKTVPLVGGHAKSVT